MGIGFWHDGANGYLYTVRTTSCMSDCPNSTHGHEIVYNEQFRVIDPEEIAQSGYCKHCGAEVRRVYVASHVEDRPIDEPGKPLQDP